MRWVRWLIVLAFLFLFPSWAAAEGYLDPYLPPGATQHSTSSSNQVQQQTLPPECKDPSQFEGCPTSYFILDYVGKDVGITDGTEYFQEILRGTCSFFLNQLWNIYTVILVLVIYVFRFSYKLDLMGQLVPVMRGVLDKSETYIWGVLFAWVFVIAFIFALVKFLQVRRQEAYMIILRNIAIVAFSSYILTQMPAIAEVSSKITGSLSDYVLAGFLSVTPEKQNKQKPATDRITDALWNELYYKPYLVLEFGSIENGQKYIRSLFSYGKDDEDKRKEWFYGEDQYGRPLGTKFVAKDSGVAQIKGFEMVTAAGLTKRFSYELFITVTGTILSVLLVMFCWKLLKWFFVGLGRVLFTAFSLLMAMWPERSFRDVVDWILRVCFAFFMRVFLACVLGIALTIFMILRDLKIDSGTEFSWLVTFLSRSILVIACFAGIWMVMKEVQHQLMSLSGVAKEPVLGDALSWFWRIRRVGDWMEDRVETVFGAVKEGLKTTGKIAAAVSGHPELLRSGVWQAIAEARNKVRMQRDAEEKMREMGFDPYSKRDRERYWAAMKEKGKAASASEVLSALPPLPKEEGHRFPELQSTLSEPARKVWKEMRMAGYNPLNREDRHRYVEAHPDVKQSIEEIEEWIRLPDQKKLVSVPSIGYSLPPSEPDPYTPEGLMYKRLGFHRQQMIYDQVADQLIAKRKEEFRKQEEAYRSLPFYRRWVTKRPEYKHPTQQEINKAYFDYIRKQEKRQ